VRSPPSLCRDVPVLKFLNPKFCKKIRCCGAGDTDLPPLKWSSLKYGFSMEDRINGKEEAYS
jgi:hypothetical protein